MFGRKKQQANPSGDALFLYTADGVARQGFDSEITSGLRRMLTGLLYRSELPAKIGIVSALREEGVTYTALATGLALAHDTPRRICVIETNWWFPGLQDLLEPQDAKGRKKNQVSVAEPTLEQSPGLAGVLQNEISLDEALIATSLDNLSLLPAGSLPVEVRPGYARSEQLPKVLADLGNQFDHLILDIPALLSTSDSIALVSHCDACCMVVRQGATSVNQVRLALDEIRHLQMMGVILNRARIYIPRWIRSLIEQE
jgi:Mrp family chromosome partitioning ATPase